MSKRRRPTRHDLLVVIGRLQDLIGRAKSDYDAEPIDRADRMHASLDEAFDLCVDVRSHDPIVSGGPWDTP